MGKGRAPDWMTERGRDRSKREERDSKWNSARPKQKSVERAAEKKKVYSVVHSTQESGSLHLLPTHKPCMLGRRDMKEGRETREEAYLHL